MRHQGDPIGQRIRIGPAGPFTIVGVVGDVKQASLAATDSYAVYINAEQSWFADNPMSLVVRARGDATALSSAIREAIWSIDKDQPVARIATMSDLLRTSTADRRFALLLFAAFALTSLILAAAGIYSVIAGTVADRTREIGIRAAIGATRGAILRLVLGQGIVLTQAGLLVGLVGASAVTKFLETLLFGITPLDPATFAAASVMFVLVATFASYIPARRATRVDPVVSLRCE
jgi:putative ABC transport system permease protein